MHHPMHFLSFVALFTPFITAVPYSQYILAPDSRTIYPALVHQVNGTVSNAASLIGGPNGSAVITNTSSVTFDYGKNIAGVVSVTVGTSSSPDAFIGLTYTESSLWINGQGSDATGNSGLDEVLWLPVGEGPGTYSVARWHERGGFRYLSLIGNTTSTIEVTAVTTNFTAAPVQDLRAYTGYFHSNDELVNRVWYAGAYTNQLCNLNPQYGNSLVAIDNTNVTLPNANPWYSNTTITSGSSCVTDGAKRDRLVWPGDMSVALPSIFASTNDMDSVKNSLNSLLALQNATTGLLPYAGYPFNENSIVSFTYHLYSLIGISYLYHYTGDLDYLESVWHNFTKGLSWSLSYIDDTGLMYVTSSADWLRVGMGGHNIEANAILYYTLNQGLDLAATINDSASISLWSPIAEKIKVAANDLLWNATAGLYHDNETTLLCPQDGNTWAIKANLTLNSTQNSQISSALEARWGPYGAPAPEAGGTILTVSPFISSFELQAHFISSSPLAALDLIRLQWGFMLDDPRMTNSTFIEGYSADGSLHYTPYSDDPRVSHSHGWSTGPTSSLSFYVAGLQLVGPAGSEWLIAPQLGDLTEVEAGFESPLGHFWSKSEGSGNGTVTNLEFQTPEGTSGSVTLLGVQGKLVNGYGEEVVLVNGEASGLKGGKWMLVN